MKWPYHITMNSLFYYTTSMLYYFFFLFGRNHSIFFLYIKKTTEIKTKEITVFLKKNWIKKYRTKR